MSSYILALDQGTTSCRALIFDKNGKILASAQEEFPQYFPEVGWVEHDPLEIWTTQERMARKAVQDAGLTADQIAAIGITNQRETVVVWDKSTGEPVYPAIVWQDRRTADFCDQLKAEGKAGLIQQKTGLVIDAYFSATKVKWILDNVPGAREKAMAGDLYMGTIDSWLIWKMTGGQKHITDVTNASRTLLYNLTDLGWDADMLTLFDIPSKMLPQVCDSSEVYGHTQADFLGAAVPIAGIAGDQQAALFGQMCTQEGWVKNTYGTGCFMLMNIGDKPILSKNNLLTTIGWKIGDEVSYALEGSIFMAGAIVQWLRDQLEFFGDAQEIEGLASSVESSDGVVLVPAFVGLGAPHWNQQAKGQILGLNRGSHKGHIARAALEAIALQTRDILSAMEADSGVKIKELRVDGGASVNNLLMQIQADVLGVSVVRPKMVETTVSGAAFLAGLAVGYWSNTEEIERIWEKDQTFEANPDRSSMEQLLAQWDRAIETVLFWSKA
ncbi:glycerol kinase GlpK [Aureicoccus marinus]|uniref:Glycerol kinase n=1 Tax=Aureicoccus marinus TaxID=754435 RepID=A0A2S7TA24_9FLAO|nr:glycerol kinase GlpK [Aureicoccus marinus]PQJ16484.1 glycerol kinase [Aureicoccus marinus]